MENNAVSIDNKTLNEKIRLNQAFINYDKIVQKNFQYKYSYLDEWVLKKSKLLLKETEDVENLVETKFRKYRRGTIIKVDFGVGLGSEMSQVHFAIVLNNYDNQKNNILTVVPLTSKNNNGLNLDLGPLIIENLVDNLKDEIYKIGLLEESDNLNKAEKNIKLEKLTTVLKYYKSNVKNTYACCSLITSISKTRILNPINEYDIIGHTRCSKDVMDKIDNEIKNRFTKKLDNNQ